jgi:hypothetical protein
MKTLPLALVTVLLPALGDAEEAAGTFAGQAALTHQPAHPAGSVAAVDLTAGLVAFYDFNDEALANSVIRDRSGNGADLAPGRGVMITGTDGVFGNGVRFDGTAVLQARGNPLAGATQFTVSLWFKCVDPSLNMNLIGAARWAGGVDASGWVLGLHYPEAWADGAAGSLRIDSGWTRQAAFLPNQWNHLVVTCDGGTLREYINGRVSAESPGSGQPVGEGVPMVVGGWRNGFYFRGAMDEVRLYRRALSPEEIRDLQAKPGGPVIHAQTDVTLALMNERDLSQASPATVDAPPVVGPVPAAPPLGVTGNWHGKSVNAETMSDTFLDITEHEDGTLTGMWGCRGVCEVKIENGERLSAELLRWESTTPGATSWHVVARVDGRSMVIERTGGAAPTADRNRHGNLGTSVLIRD